MVDLARKNLLHDKLRFFITLSGVAFAVMLVLVQLGLFFGMLKNATITIDKLEADLWVTSRNTHNVDFAHTFPESRVQRVRAIPGVQRADNLIVTFMDFTLPNGAQDATLVYALEHFEEWRFPWSVEEGRVSDLRRGNCVFVDNSAVRRFGSFSTGEYREYLGTRLKIIGRTNEARSFTTTPISFMDYSLAQRLMPGNAQDQTTYILVKLAPGANLEQVRAELQRRLPYNDVHTAAEWAARSRAYWIDNTGLGFNMVMTVFLGCLVGVVVVAQTLYTSTMEHLREFGTVKAIGGSNRDIYGILARQALISAGVGFVLGIIPTLLVRELVPLMDLELIISFKLVLTVLIGTVGMCLAAAMISFRKVASIDPALVFRT
ncbi:ABC transporter permease [Cystobacter fuscus]|uniref:ABC transporter permease n=1 Tax=Cystobacter fuscus TaxID=43 RepID=A0A250J0S9_9BACT|nr:ABC transporter permease [Cystobacter fuscus]ATB37153.1 ABC transporter permease [Cystobacter fuscus]